MLLEIELLYFVAMIATFVILLLVCKVPAGISLMVSAVIGAVLSAIFSKTDLSIRHFVEGGFGYFDTILVIVTAMIFIGGLEASGALDYISVLLIKVFYKFPTILLIFFMLIIMLPGMITGSSLASVISAGAIVAPIMLKMGIPKAKVGAIIAFGAILGMIAPPINIPVMVICDVVDIPYTGFTLPLIALTFPLAVFCVLFLSRSYKKNENNEKTNNKLETIIILSILGLVLLVLLLLLVINYSTLYLSFAIIYGVLYLGIVFIMLYGKAYSSKIDLDEMKTVIDIDVTSKLSWTVTIPFIILILLFISQSIFPRAIGMLGTPLLFVIAYIFTIFLGKKKNNILVIKDSVKKSFSAMALLMGVGMFVQIMTLNGVRGYFVINALSLPSIWQYVSIGIAMPIFGGISAFGSASILGGPFVMALLAYNEIIVAAGLSLVAAIGEFLPPTAMSATFAAKMVKEEKYSSVTKAAIVPLIVCLGYAMLFVAVISRFWI